jgi:OFA family oxalate/formate antiporter-like MFS transporter
MNKKDQLTDLHIKKKPYVITRWSIPVAGFLLALMGGISYAWGVFVVPVT